MVLWTGQWNRHGHGHGAAPHTRTALTHVEPWLCAQRARPGKRAGQPGRLGHGLPAHVLRPDLHSAAAPGHEPYAHQLHADGAMVTGVLHPHSLTRMGVGHPLTGALDAFSMTSSSVSGILLQVPRSRTVTNQTGAAAALEEQGLKAHHL